MPRQPLITAMFTRRLLLLAAIGAAGFIVPVVQLARLTLAKGPDFRRQAEDRLENQRWEPTIRGKILDRKGRILAADRPTYDLVVDYPVITGKWASTQAAKAARKKHREEWSQLTPIERENLVNAEVDPFNDRLKRGWTEFSQLTGVSAEDLDRRRQAIIEQVERTVTSVYTTRLRTKEDELARQRLIEGKDLSVDVSIADVEVALSEQTSPYVLVHDIDEETALRFPIASASSRAEVSGIILPGVHVVASNGREYPMEEMDVSIDRSTFPGPLRSADPLTVHVAGVATPIVGWMRSTLFTQADDEDRWAAARDAGRITPDAYRRGRYRPGDAIGNWGIEQSAEEELRGLRGLDTEQLDTGNLSVIPPVPGRDIKLTIDAALQARVQAVMSPEAGLAVVQPWQHTRSQTVGTALHGACVIIDVDSGDILSMVSTPSFTRRQIAEDPTSVFGDEGGQTEAPIVNRAISRPYPPGSIVKPLMLAAAATAGAFDPNRIVDCTGHLYPDHPNLFRCWIYKSFGQTHGPLDASDAIMVSCNIYFFTVGRALGPRLIADWYANFGVGRNARHPDLGLNGQYPGVAGPAPEIAINEEDTRDINSDDTPPSSPPPVHRTGVVPGKGGLSLSEATLMGIGQGPVAWTPLHAADAYATLARRGTRILPRLRADAPMETIDLKLNPVAVDKGLAGLFKSANDRRGTSNHIMVAGPDGFDHAENIFTARGVTVWAKSGTADSGQEARDASGNIITDDHGQPVSLDHAWVVALVGPTAEGRPKYAIALLVENGGSGGKVSGPIANQVIEALIAEGYL